MESIKDDIEKGITILEELNSSLASIGSVLEWGFGEIAWRQEQQTDILRGIDATLRTPGETRANELRLQAEELRHRGLYPESEELLLNKIPLVYAVNQNFEDGEKKLSDQDELAIMMPMSGG